MDSSTASHTNAKLLAIETHGSRDRARSSSKATSREGEKTRQRRSKEITRKTKINKDEEKRRARRGEH